MPPGVRVVEVGTVPKPEVGVDPLVVELLEGSEVEVVEVEVLDVVVGEIVVVDFDAVDVPPHAARTTSSSAGVANLRRSERRWYP